MISKVSLAAAKFKFSGRQTALNMICAGCAFAANMLLGFFLTPFIVKHLGSTANGFIGLSFSFTTYASLIVIALNSMAGRFIAMAYFQHQDEEVHKYYSSVFIADLLICAILILPMTVLLVLLPRVIHIPTPLRLDVTLLFAFTFAEFMVMTVGSVYSNSSYVVNRIDLVAARTIETKMLRLILVVAIFLLFPPRLWYLGGIHLACSVYNMARNYFIHRSLMPDIHISRKYFDLAKIRELLASGVWNSISSLSAILLGNLDLLIVNLFISAEAMGLLSVAKVVPLCIEGLLCNLGSTIAPSLTKFYAEGDYSRINKTLLFNEKLMAALFCVPIGLLAAFGMDFYRLWVPALDAKLLWILSAVWLIPAPFSLSLQPLNHMFSSANKVKINSLVTIVCAAASVGTMFGLLHAVESPLARMIVVIITGKAFMFVKDVAFNIPYISYLTHGRMWDFYFTPIKNCIVSVFVFAVCFAVRCQWRADDWLSLIASGALAGVAGEIICCFLVFDHEERDHAWKRVKSRLTPNA